MPEHRSQPGNADQFFDLAPELRRPIVIFGGFLTFTMVYRSMRNALNRITGQPVWIVETWGHDWLSGVSRLGWPHLLRKLDQTVRAAANSSSTGKVTLVGHSAGGVLARLYLSPDPFLGRTYRGLDHVGTLITLGSPHRNQGGMTQGGAMARWIEQRYPGAYYAPSVDYVSVAGRVSQGNRSGSRRERWVYNIYREIGGDGSAWGDGLVPIRSALLNGAYQLVLDGVSHFRGFGGPWYGDEAVIPGWWNAWVARYRTTAAAGKGERQ